MRHFLIICIFAGLVSLAFGIVGRETLHDRFFYGLKLFIEFIGIALILGWGIFYLPI